MLTSGSTPNIAASVVSANALAACGPLLRCPPCVGHHAPVERKDSSDSATAANQVANATVSGRGEQGEPPIRCTGEFGAPWYGPGTSVTF